MNLQVSMRRIGCIAAAAVAVAILFPDAASAGIAVPAQLQGAGDGLITLIQRACALGAVAGIVWLFASMKFGGGERIGMSAILILVSLGGMAMAPAIVDYFQLGTANAGGMTASYVGPVEVR